MEQDLFSHVLDAVESMVGDDHGALHGSAHRRGVKVWFGPAEGRAAKEHYEAQLIRHGDGHALEIGFHAEHRDPARNQATLHHLLEHAPAWRSRLGDEPEAGPFLGMEEWARVSEIWEPPDPDDPETPMEIAARLTDYVDAIEPVRQTERP